MNIQSPPFDDSRATTWWAIVLRGVLAVAFGVVTLASPAAGATTIVLIFSVFAVADGVAALIASARRGRSGQRWSWFLFEGIASVAAGIIAFAYTGATFFLLVVLVALRAIVLGVLDVAGAVAGKGLDSRWLWALGGLLSVVFGVLLLARPLQGGIAVLWTIGAYAIVVGIMAFAYGLHLRGLQRHAPEEDVHLGGHAAIT